MDGPFFVMNGDLLTDVDFSAMLDRHRQTGAAVTIGTHLKHERLEFGVLKLDSHGGVAGYDEKPTLDLHISMGLYVMEPAVLETIPDRFYDMPELIIDSIAAGARVKSWIHEGRWLDIGRVADYSEANEIFKADPTAFLPSRVR
jgi:NDP-sugar pyrophosphorylase family protein